MFNFVLFCFLYNIKKKINKENCLNFIITIIIIFSCLASFDSHFIPRVWINTMYTICCFANHTHFITKTFILQFIMNSINSRTITISTTVNIFSLCTYILPAFCTKSSVDISVNVNFSISVLACCLALPLAQAK